MSKRGASARHAWYPQWFRYILCCVRLTLSGVMAIYLLSADFALAQTDTATEFYNLLNQVRLQAGFAPLGKSTLLQQAAQRHAEDISQRGIASHEGSDGSNYQQRIREAGYRAWNDGLMVNEAVWIGLGSSVDALNWFRSNAETWMPFVDAHYREVGVGYAKDDQGARYFVVTFGSRPGVLPVFVNDGMDVTDSPQVAVRLTNEEAVPLGEGTWMGKAIEVRLNDTPGFDNVPWQPWEPLLPWLLPATEPGDYAIYVEFRDGADRTAVSEATIRLVAPGESPPTPTPHAAIVPAPDLLQTPTEESPEAQPGEVPTTPMPSTPVPTPGSITTPVVSYTPQPTWTPLPIETLAPVEEQKTDWPLLTALMLQGIALLLGVAVFLRRR